MADNKFYKFERNGSLIIPDTSEILKGVQAEWTNIFGSTLNLDPSTPQGRIIELIANNRKQTLELCALMANQINPYYSAGQSLDALASLFGVNRKVGVATSVLCEVHGTAGTIIPSGSKAKTAAGDIFITLQSIYIDNSGDGYGVFYSEEKGNIPCAVGALNEIVTQVVGWQSIRNNVAAVLGSVEENDTDFRQRIINMRYSGVSLLESVKSALYKVPDIIDFAFYNNASNYPYVWDGVVTIPPHSICVVVYGGDDTNIAKSLFETVTIGCGYAAINATLKREVEITYSSGNYETVYPIIFNRPQPVNIACKITVARNKYAGENIVEDIKNAISSWGNNEVENVEGLTIGSTVYTYEIGAAVSQQMPEIVVRDVQIGLKSDGTYSNASLDFNITQLPALNEADIIVEVV